ncbi:LysR family transcriptional regulator [Bradyrhizobium japonicum]|uniref:LysR family transcriptional regulator n=1 Tax=Bradyrhizobium japonicum TaxID=375 RepID=UPI001BA7629C|nr:LysR family transcriptional regulator [Bradyrhizobium japonicum]MBR0956646.1 LysR family transcriptional regulator [Bradyrhizobium japonicum]
MAINLRKIDLNLLVIFEALYSTGNTSKAAERLGMSQPAVSSALGRLRELLGDPLFVRSPRGVAPTNKAREIIQPVREALAVIGRQFTVADSIDLATYTRLFRIIVSDPLEALVMPSIVRTLLTQAPGVQIECVQATARYAEDIREGNIDLACFAFPIDTTDIVVKSIMAFDLVVISRRDHPEITKPLDLATFARLPQVAVAHELRGLTGVDKNMVAQGTVRRTPYMVSKIWSMPAMVQRTDLIGLLPRRFAEEIADNFQLDLHDLPMPLAEQYAYMLWHVNSENDPGHKWLRESIMQGLQSNRPAGIQ